MNKITCVILFFAFYTEGGAYIFFLFSALFVKKYQIKPEMI